MIPNCAATRHIHFELDGSGVAQFTPPKLEDYPDVHWKPAADARRVNLDNITRADIAKWQPGETLLLSGKLLTGRDAAHKRITEMLARGEKLPPGVDFNGRFIYYVGPVDPVRDEVVGPAGPTTATRMDKFTETMLAQTGLIGMIGKAERGKGDHRVHQAPRGGIPDCSWRRRLSGVPGHSGCARRRVCRSRHGSDL